MSFIYDLAKATITLFIIIDPIGLIPIFMALTQDCTREQRRAIFSQVTLVAFILLVAFALAGNGILSFFGITLGDFKIAGGLLLLVLALHITSEAHYGQQTVDQPGVVPLAIPLLAGPGAITTTIVLIRVYKLWITLLALAITMLTCFVIFRYVVQFYHLIGRTGSDVIAKIMGMLLAAIAVQFIRQGIQEVFNLR